MSPWLIGGAVLLLALVLICARVPSFAERLVAALAQDLGGDPGVLHVKYRAMQEESRRRVRRRSRRLDRERGRSRVSGVGHHASLPPLHRRATQDAPHRDDGHTTRLR